jgi:heterodisulfide reductase subunit C
MENGPGQKVGMMATKPEGKSFADELLEDIRFTSHVRGLKTCNQCGSCTSVCPAARFSNGGYNPRTIVKRVLEGDRDILRDPIIWDCFYCYSCHMSCPQQVSPAILIQVLRTRAILEGYADEQMADFLDYGECFFEFGIGSTPNQFFPDVAKEWGPKWEKMRGEIEEIRQELGLMPTIPPDEAIDQIQYIMRRTGFLDYLEIFRKAYRKKHKGKR